MQLEDHFGFLTPLDIRITGHRIGIDDVLSYHRDGLTAHQITERLPALRLEQIYGCLTYYYRWSKPADSRGILAVAA